MDRFEHTNGHLHRVEGGLKRRPVKVMKFGGTSVGAPDRLLCLAGLVEEAARTHPLVVIASAANGVTDRLVASYEEAVAGVLDLDGLFMFLHDRHVTLARDVLGESSARTEYAASLKVALARLELALRKVLHTGASMELKDEIIGAGERASVPLVRLAIEQAGIEATATDATSLVRTDTSFGEAVVDLDETAHLVQTWFEEGPRQAVRVVTGFIGATPDGRTTTLGRGGSDYSAALVAYSLGAEVLERWTDVDGIYTADPRSDQSAQRLACIVLEEARAWNQAGRLGMHRKALDPLVAAGIPVRVRCTAAPEKPGTWIVPSHADRRHVIGL
jgi:aspartate kinase